MFGASVSEAAGAAGPPMALLISGVTDCPLRVHWRHCGPRPPGGRRPPRSPQARRPGGVGVNPIVNLGKQRLKMMGNLVHNGGAVLRSDNRV